MARYAEGQLLLTVVSNGKWRHDLSPLYERLRKSFLKREFSSTKTTCATTSLWTKNSARMRNRVHKGRSRGRALPPWRGQLLSGERRRKGYSLPKGKAIAARCGHAGADRLFSGIGVLTNALADQNYLTYGVEIVPQAVQDANAMSKLAKGKVINVCGDANEVLPRLAKEHEGKKCVWWWIRRAKAWAKRCAKQ